MCLAPLTYHISINARASVVWECLVNPNRIRQWMVDEGAELHVDSTWQRGSTLRFRGSMHGVDFCNDGIIVELREAERLCYTHRSSLSALPDDAASYVVMDFSLESLEHHTVLHLCLSNFPTLEIAKHLELYWPPTLQQLKLCAESYALQNTNE